MKKRKRTPIENPPPPLLKLDFGCGPNPTPGYDGVDVHAFDGKVKHVVDLRKTPWPWPDESVADAVASHFIEHLTKFERVDFANELERVLVPGGTCRIVVPHWASCRAYGDPTHEWPPVSEFWFYYLNREWRLANAPHVDASVIPNGFKCDLGATWGYSIRQDVAVRNAEFQNFAIQNYKEVCQDIVATITKPIVQKG